MGHIDLPTPWWPTGNHHVRVVDGLHLVDVVSLKAGVHRRVQRVQQVHKVHGRVLDTDLRELGDTREQYGCRFEILRVDFRAPLETLRDRPGEHLIN